MMRISEHFAILVLTSFPSANPALAQKQLAQSPRILSAKSVYFNNKTGSDAVGKNALAQLRKWGKFQLVTDPKQADLIYPFRRPLQRRQHHLREWPDRHHLTTVTSPKTPFRKQAIFRAIRMPDGD
jgi:hypothetical protein